jgi:hypothetical protein
MLNLLPAHAASHMMYMHHTRSKNNTGGRGSEWMDTTVESRE